MLHSITSVAAWTPESDAACKTPESDALLLPLASIIPTRAARSQSLTEPTTPPLIVPSAATSPHGSEAVSNAHTHAPSSRPVGLTLLQQQQLSQRGTSRRDRRSMSAEFSLSMLQQELGYPTRKSSRGSRRDSIDRALRRTSSIREEEEGSEGEKSITTAPIYSSSSSTTGSTSGRRCDDSDGVSEPDPERTVSNRNSIEALPKHAWPNSSNNRSTIAQHEDEDEEENFMDSRVASITGFSQDTDGVVYYEIIVRSVAHGPLSAYKVRRRYSEFRDLHRALSKIMSVGSSRRLPTGSAAAMPPFGVVHGNESTVNDDELVEDLETSGLLLTPSSTASGAGPGVVLQPSEMEPRLPPLPDRGGLWSYFQFDTTPFLERRAQYFHAILVAAQHHRRARESRLLNEFLGPPPDSIAVHTSVENSYVSLNRFAAPKLRLSVEAQERKQKARNISRRRSSLTQLSSARQPDLPYQP
uniref:PX domain-containing protein n=1 Tax=Globisporangium ultimum (strain ATCC 200006 / CBS 805.95 / DAOM BR144) TaxID=431595 RepID=K3WJA7_GLOUD